MKSQDSKLTDEDGNLDESMLLPIPKYGMLVKITKLNMTNDGSLHIEYDADSVQMREDKIDENDLDKEVEKIIVEALTREEMEDLG